MKLLYCYRYGILGGVCAQLINRMQYLRTRPDVEVHLLFGQDHGISQTLDSYPHVYFEPDVRNFRRLLTREKYDTVIVIDTPEYLEAMIGAPDERSVITEVHTTTERGLQYLAQRKWSTAGYIVPSQYSKEMLATRFQIGIDEIVEVVPNCLDPELFEPVKIDNAPERPIVAWVGKLDSHKNWRGFLDIAGIVTARGVDVEYWMFGGETASDTSVTDLLETIESYDLMSRCRWFDRVEYKAMKKVYSAVAQSGGCTLVTSINESFGMSVLESLMCGCPVVASAVGAIPEIAPGKLYLQCYPLDDITEAADRVEEFLRKDVSQHNRQRLAEDRLELAERYSPKTVGERYLDIVKTIIQTHAQASLAAD